MAGDSSLADSGISGQTEEGVTLIVVLVFLSLSFYNVLELTLIIFTTFKQFRGLYFWSFLVATWGIALWSLGFVLKDTGVSKQYLLYMPFIEIGWTCMVTGQSMVLYSRLHIVLHSRKKLRMALYMIIFDAIICHVPIIVVAFGTNSPNPGPFIVPYSVYEKVQVSIFFVQELILSGLYISETVKMMRIQKGTNLGDNHGGPRKLMKHLVLVNVIIVLLDITILGLEYAGYFQLQTAYKGLVYSVKLKMEFSILNRLVEMVSGGATHSSGVRGPATLASRVDKGGIQLNTFDPTASVDGERRRRDDVEFGGGPGYNAYVHGGDHKNAPRGGPDTGRAITRTTEVVIHRSDDDTDSMDGKSGITDDGRIHGEKGARRQMSASSSEVQFARA